VLRIRLQFDAPPVLDQEFGNLDFYWTHIMTTNYAVRNGVRESCKGSDVPSPELNRFLKSSGEPTYVNSTGHTNPSAGWRWWYFPKDCVWSIPKDMNMAIVDTVTEVLGDQQAIMGLNQGVMGSHHLRVLFQEGNITFNSLNERMGGLATAMTTVVRTNGGAGNLTNYPEEAIGTVWNNTTCMYI
jgi:hypothetical protein